MNAILKKIFFAIILLIFIAGNGFSQTPDFSNSKIICFEKNDKLVLKSVFVFLFLKKH